MLEIDHAAKGGATLKILQGLSWLHEKIQEGHYDLVILQDELPELTEQSVAPFHEHVRRFDQEIRSVGRQTALFTHQTIHGTYLAANVIYAVLFGANPQRLSHRPAGVSAEEAAFLQSIAWTALLGWQKTR